MDRRSPNGLLRGLALLALFGAACGAQPVTNVAAAAAISAVSHDYETHSDRVEVDTPKAMCGALYVELATVRGFGPSRWNTPGGAVPVGDLDQLVRQLGYLIYTPLNRSDITALIDHRTTASREYVSYGGQLAGTRMADGAYPQLRVGSRYVLVFLPTIQGGTGRIDSSTVIAHNAFPVLSGDRVQLQQMTTEQGLVTQQEVTIPLNDLIAQLGTC